MKYFFIDSTMDETFLEKFFQFINENSEDDWTIAILSTGGMSTIMKTVLYIINMRAERVTLILNEAYSCAFELFYYSKCKKVVTYQSKGMIHLHYADVSLMTNGAFKELEQKCVAQNWKDNNPNEKIAKKILTNAEFKKFKIGEETYLTTKRIKEIFPDAEII